MTTDDADAANKRTIRHKILRCITDRPGQVVYRDQIVEEAGVTDRQVVSSLHRFLSEGSDFAKDINVVVNGNAWRYMPNTKAVRAMRAQEASKSTATHSKTRNKNKPLTQSIRDYFHANPGRVIYLPELQEAMSTTDTPMSAKEIQVGVNNSKHYADQAYLLSLRTVHSGRAWQFIPTDEFGDDNSTDDATTPEPISATVPKPAPPQPQPQPQPPLPTSEPSTPSTTAGDELMMIEKLSVLDDGSLLVRDTSDRQIYVLSKPKLK